MDLREYERAKFELAEILRSLATLCKDRPHEEQGRLRELFARLAEDRFNLVVVGRFSRGKTSLMNAILGTDRLPTGIVPLTSVITTVAYGSKEQVIISYPKTCGVMRRSMMRYGGFSRATKKGAQVIPRSRRWPAYAM
jgi:predicted GTPase